MVKEEGKGLEFLPCSALKQKILCLGNSAVDIAKRLLWHKKEYISITTASYIPLPLVSWLSLSVCLGEGKRQEGGKSGSHFSSTLQCPFQYLNKNMLLFHHHFAGLTIGNINTVTVTTILLNTAVTLLIENQGKKKIDLMKL